MSWTHSQHPDHEGFVLGLVRTEDHKWRELGHGDPPNDRVVAVQIGCDCGWRSPRLLAPLRTKWFPLMVATDAVFEDELRRLWNEHVLAAESNATCKSRKAPP